MTEALMQALGGKPSTQPCRPGKRTWVRVPLDSHVKVVIFISPQPRWSELSLSSDGSPNHQNSAAMPKARTT